MANPIELHGDPAAKNKKEQSGQLPVAAPGNGSWVFRPKKKIALNVVYESNTTILSIYE
jgi:hypothetical protein